MHRVKGPVDRKEQEGNSSGSSYRKRRKKYGKPDKSGYQQDEWGYQHRGYPAAGGGVRIDRLGHLWDVPESMQPTARVLAPPSDPGLCRYAVQAAPSPYFPYTYGPIALAVCQEPNFYQAPAAPVPHLNSPVRVSNHSSSRTGDQKCPRSGRRYPPRSSKYKPVQNSALARSATHDCQPNSGNFNEYLSLPPGMQDPCNDDAHRRFSDPGLGNPNSDTDSNRRNLPKHESSDSESSLLDEWPPDTARLVEQVKLLRADNKRLASELRDTKVELQQLKLQTSTWRNQKSDEYQPGMIADLVREVRDAARMREETLVTRLRLMVSDGLPGRLSGSASVQSVYGEVAGLQNNNKSVSLPDRDMAERLSRLEDQLEGLRINKGGTEPSANNVSAEIPRLKHLDGESNDKTTSELCDALKARKDAETNSLKYDVPPCKNGPAKMSIGQDAVNDTETEESLASVCSSTLSSLSTPAACVTMSGPVTDL